MRPNLESLRIATSLIFLTMMFTAQAVAQDSELPRLSEEIQRVLDQDGPEAAKQRFDEIFPAQKDKYEIDTQALVQIGSEYMNAGNYESGQAIMSMVAVITRDMIANSELPTGATESARAAQERSEREESRTTRSAARVPDRGPAREDLARFRGVYGDPEQPESRRKLFVTESCDGYLVAGAMWGDAQNWWMRSVSEDVFEMSSDFMSLRLEFELGPDGTVQAMKHDLEGMPSPLEKQGPLPEGWGECLQRRER